MRLWQATAITAAALVFGGTARADIIFSDTFDTTGGSVLNWDGGPNWSVPTGTVDLVASGEYSIDCLFNTGHCVDMDGSTGDAGELISINLGPLAAGDYEFSYWLSGNQRNSTFDIVVALSFSDGGFLSTSNHFLLGNDGWQQFTQGFTLTSVTDPLYLTFIGQGGDNIGGLLDNVELRRVPEPGSLALLGIGLFGMGLARRRKHH